MKMKKVLSMFLAVAVMVSCFTALSTQGVLAVKNSIDSSGSTREITVTTGTTDGTSAIQAFATGHYTVITNSGTEDEHKYDFGTISNETVSGIKYRHIQFNENTILDSDKDTKNYMRIATSFLDAAPTATGMSTTNALKTVTTKNLTDAYAAGNLYRYTFYMYSKEKSGMSLTIPLIATNSQKISTSLSMASDIYSENGIPHKVDVVFGANENVVFMNVFVDGVKLKTSDKTYTYTNAKENIQIRPYINFGFNKSSSLPVPKTDMYMTYEDEAVNIETVSIADLSKEFPSGVTFGASPAIGTDTGDYITGLTSDAKTVLETSLRSTATDTDRTATFYGAKNVSDIFANTADTNVTVVSRTTNEAIEPSAYPTTDLNNTLLKVNGIYVLPEAKDWEVIKATNNPFMADGKTFARVKRNDYSVNDAPEAVGGLSKGFYTYSSEQRTAAAWSTGSFMYDNQGYYQFATSETPNDGTAAYNSHQSVVTADFTVYVPEYSPQTSKEAHNISFSVGTGDTSSTRVTSNSMFIVTDADTAPAAVKNGAYIAVKPNSWSHISMRFDFSTTAVDGKVKRTVYVNGEKQDTADYVLADKNNILKNMAAAGKYRFYFLRFNVAPYNSVSVLSENQGWYYGVPEGTAVETTTNKITVSGNDNIKVNEANKKIISSLDDESIIAAMESLGYEPVYLTTSNIAKITEEYEKIDGKMPTSGTVIIGGKSHTYWTGAAIGRWAKAVGAYDADAENGVSSTYINKSQIISIEPVKDESGNFVYDPDTRSDEYAKVYKLVVNSDDKLNASTSVSAGVATPLAEILAIPGTNTKTLAGFAAVEDGKLPNIYDLVKSDLVLKSVSVDADGKGRLSYERYEDVTTNGALVIAVLDKTKNVIGLYKKNVADDITNGGYGNDLNVELDAGGVANAAYYKAFFFRDWNGFVPGTLGQYTTAAAAANQE